MASASIRAEAGAANSQGCAAFARVSNRACSAAPVVSPVILMSRDKRSKAVLRFP